MSKLSKLLDAKEPLFSLSLRQLEKFSGKKGVDVKLIAEINSKFHERTKELGLDSKDTTGPELYHAMLDRIRKDNERVTRMVGGTDHSDILDLMPRLLDVVKQTKTPQDCWVLKRSVAKDILREMPPKKMMDHLGYKSIDSMLKREPFDELYVALRFSEGGDWLNEYNELFKKVSPSDFETRKISFVLMDHDKWVDLAGGFTKKKLHNITHSKEMGIITVVPMHVSHMPGMTLKSLPLLYHYINEVRLYSAFFKLIQVKKDFAAEIVETLIADPEDHAVLAGQNVHWRVIQRYFGKLKDEYHPEAFEPHVQPEDLHWRKAEELLFELDPHLGFWHDLDYVARMEEDGYPQTFNMMDVSFAFSNSEKYTDRYFYHFREALWNEIFMRYMGEDVLKEQILKQLDNDMIAPETL